MQIPHYEKVSAVSSPERLIIEPSTASIRPHCVVATLRNVTLDQTAYNSFIDLQDKLHQNIARNRTLVAIGTHDLDTIKERKRGAK
jgi:phenylalanyl-tRNA synthetase beta chain